MHSFSTGCFRNFVFLKVPGVIGGEADPNRFQVFMINLPETEIASLISTLGDVH